MVDITKVQLARGLAGVYYGSNAIPERWREKIIVKERLSSLSEMVEKGTE